MSKASKRHDEALNLITDSFINEAKALGQKIGASVKIYPAQYNGKKARPDKFKCQDVALDLGSYALIFTYYFIPRSGITIRSIVKMDLFITRPDLKLGVPLDLLMNLIDPHDFTPFVYQEVTDPTVMRAIFEVTTEWFENHRSGIETLVSDEKEVVDLSQAVDADFRQLYKTSEPINRDNNLVYLFAKSTIFLRPAYQLFLIGEYKKSMALYKKKNYVVSAYEVRFLKLMLTRMSIDGYKPRPLVPECIAENYRYFRPKTFSKRIQQELLSFLVTILLIMSMMTIFGGLMTAIVTFGVHYGSLYTSIQPWSFYVLLMLLVGVNMGLAFRIPVQKRLFKKDHPRYQALDDIYRSNADNNVFRGAAILMGVTAIVVTILFVFDVVSFKPDRFVTSTLWENGSLYNVHTYDEIAYLEFCPYWYDQDGARIDEPYYQIVYKDGTTYSLVDYMSVAEVEKYLIPIMIDKGVVVAGRDD